MGTVTESTQALPCFSLKVYEIAAESAVISNDTVVLVATGVVDVSLYTSTDTSLSSVCLGLFLPSCIHTSQCIVFPLSNEDLSALTRRHVGDTTRYLLILSSPSLPFLCLVMVM